jgi:hypothetical protein
MGRTGRVLKADENSAEIDRKDLWERRWREVCASRMAHFTISARHEGIPRILATLRRAIRLPGTLVREA